MNISKLTFILLAIIALSPAMVFGQSNEDMMGYLENTVSYKYNYLTNGAFKQISNLEVINVKIDVNFDKNEYGGSVYNSYLLKNAAGFKKIQTPDDFIKMPEFLKSLKSDFKLKTPEDGLVLQTALNIISMDDRNEGFFFIDNKWYFIRSKFFGSYYIIETDSEGKITKIKHTKGIEADIPDEVYFNGENKNYPDFIMPEISKSEEGKILKFIKQNLKFHFEIEAEASEYFSKISSAKLYDAKFILSEKYGEDNYETVSNVKLITYKSKIISSSKIWETELFIESTKPIFKLINDADAKLFQNFLNEMEAKIENVRFYKKEGFFLFVRDKIFDEERGYIVKTNKNGEIERIASSGFSDTDILRFRIKDPDFKVDYKFKLKKPAKTVFNFVKKDLDIASEELGKQENIDVVIEFNEKAVNAMGAWILTRYNGDNFGIFASTDMKSPFTQSIPVNELEQGNHKVEFLLLRPGEATDNPLGIVSLEINIE